MLQRISVSARCRPGRSPGSILLQGLHGMLLETVIGLECTFIQLPAGTRRAIEENQRMVRELRTDSCVNPGTTS